MYYREIPRISLSLILRLIHDARVFAAHDDNDGAAAAIIGLFSGGIRTGQVPPLMLGKAATTVDLLNIWFLSRETFNKVLLLFPHAASPIKRPLIDLLPKCHPPASGGTTTRRLMMYQHVIWPQLYRGAIDDYISININFKCPQ